MAPIMFYDIVPGIVTDILSYDNYQLLRKKFEENPEFNSNHIVQMRLKALCETFFQSSNWRNYIGEKFGDMPVDKSTFFGLL